MCWRPGRPASGWSRSSRPCQSGEAAAWRAASRHVAGRSRSQTLLSAATPFERGHRVSGDLFGERVSDPTAADRVLGDDKQLAGALPPAADLWLSLDLTHPALDTDPSAVADRLATIARALPRGRRVRSAPRMRPAPMRFWPACSTSRRGAWPIGSAPRYRPICCAHRPTPTGWPRPACTSGSSRATTWKPPASTPTASRPTWPTCASAFRLAERGATWSMATHDRRLREALLLAHGPVPVEQPLSTPGGSPRATRPHRSDAGLRPVRPRLVRYWLRRRAESRGALSRPLSASTAVALTDPLTARAPRAARSQAVPLDLRGPCQLTCARQRGPAQSGVRRPSARTTPVVSALRSRRCAARRARRRARPGRPRARRRSWRPW